MKMRDSHYQLAALRAFEVNVLANGTAIAGFGAA
jgi:hypothetical protein